ncbi:MAG: zinc ribbon domain-containing protein [Eubacterium sp.]|nr:zinc ribbon domain-containing protein [Eubacterium sp.]
MFCNNCGNQIDDGVVFCPYCGNKLRELNQQRTSQPNQQQGYPQMQYDQNQQYNQQVPPKQQYGQPQKNGLSTGAIIGIIAGAAVLVIVLITTILLIAFSKVSNSGSNTASSTTQATTEKADVTEATTEEASSEEATTAATEEATTEEAAGLDDIVPEMSNAYYDVLKKHKSSIKNYTWQMGYDAKQSYPVAFKDLTGDGLDELIFMEAGNEYAAGVYVYTYTNGKADEIYSQENIDMEVAGGSVFYVASLKNNEGLFIYYSVVDEGSDETFDKVTYNGGQFIKDSEYKRSSYPNDDYTEWNVSCTKDGSKINENEMDTFVNDNQANIDAYLMYSEGEDIDNLVSKKDTANMTFKKAASILKEKMGDAKDASSDSEENVTLPVDDSIIFSFSSGAGAWGTSISIDKDGNFGGGYHDSDMGDIGDGYPNGTVYVSNFTGKFTNIKKIDDYTYEMELEECTTANTIGTEEIEDGIRYVYSEPYGISGGETFYLYLPGKPISELSEGFIGWAYGVIGDISNDSEMKSYGLYNEEQDQGFFVYPE